MTKNCSTNLQSKPTENIFRGCYPPPKSNSSDVKVDIVEDFDERLPATVTILKHKNGAKVYLIGTAHFSKESQNDVIKVMRNVRPHVVVLELCKERHRILCLDEKTMLRKASSDVDLGTIIATIRTDGFYTGIFLLLFLNIYASITKKVGVAPGIEFRAAYSEARNLPNCTVVMGDRPIYVTIQRLFSKITFGEGIRLAWNFLSDSMGDVNAEIIEDMKKREVIEQQLRVWSSNFPIFKKTLVDERNVYLTHSFQSVASKSSFANGDEPLRIVGVVGMGHVDEIKRLWKEDQEPYIDEILTVPPPTLPSKVTKYTLKGLLYAFGGYILYRFVRGKKQK